MMMVMGNLLGIMKEIKASSVHDFVTSTHSYGASWYSSNLWKIVSSCPELINESQLKKKKKN